MDEKLLMDDIEKIDVIPFPQYQFCSQRELVKQILWLHRVCPTGTKFLFSLLVHLPSIYEKNDEKLKDQHLYGYSITQR